MCIGMCVLLRPVTPAQGADNGVPPDGPSATEPTAAQPATQASAPPKESGEDQPVQPEATEEESAEKGTSENKPTEETTTEDVPPAPLELEDTEDLIVEDAGEGIPVSEVLKVRIIRSAALGSDRESDPPRYVRSMAEHANAFDLTGYEHLDWLDFGIEQRIRYEHRGNYYREDQDTGDLSVLRSRIYLGVREKFDPFRFAIEYQDSRRFGDAFDDRSNINETEILQLYGELYFPDGAGSDQPLRFRFGRMSFDAIDRRLVARNRFRNTTNSFEGIRVTLGDHTTDWQIDLFAMNPVERQTESRDRVNDDTWLYGVTGYWRGWSPYITLEPYYLFLDSDDKPPRLPSFREIAISGFNLHEVLQRRSSIRSREIHTLGLHGFGVLGQSGFDYDFDVAFQFGDVDGFSHRAFAMHAEIGYLFDLPARPRLAAWVNYASGDRDPYDGVNQRFDRMFGASHSMYGYSDLFTWENMINPTVYLSVRPAATPKLRLEAFYRAYWLASKKDAWVVPGLRDPTGDSGRFVGQGIDFRARYQIDRHAAIDFGYAHFMPGSFVSDTTADADDSDFIYLQMTMRF